MEIEAGIIYTLNETYDLEKHMLEDGGIVLGCTLYDRDICTQFIPPINHSLNWQKYKPKYKLSKCKFNSKKRIKIRKLNKK